MIERRRSWFGWIAVWLSFLLVSFLSAPVPGVNESHYLTMAKHWWNPDWCSRDFFLESFPTHAVFYATIGWLTNWLSLPIVALIGRCLGLGLLAAGWCSLASQFSVTAAETDPAGRTREESPWVEFSECVMSAWMFLGIQAVGNLSGEWLIGGIESKVISYGCILLALSAVLERRFLAASVCAGIAISFHPVIGIWHVLALVIVRALSPRRVVENVKKPRSKFTVSHLLIAYVLALPGLVPAFHTLRVTDAQTTHAANFIQVFYRLKHHLDPMDFAWSGWIEYAVLAAVGLLLFARFRRNNGAAVVDRWWLKYLIAVGVFALAGLLIGLGPRPAHLMAGYRWRMALLKFYPFRLFDLLLPLTVAMWLPRLMFDNKTRSWIFGIGIVGFGWTLAKPFVVEPPIAWPANARADWVAACRWIEANTPRDALFLTPLESDSFKWHAQRAEFVNFKDCPQDAAGIVEWNRRLRLMTRWSDAGFADERYSAEELRDLKKITGAEFAMARVRVPYDADLIYSNGTFNVFRLPE